MDQLNMYIRLPQNKLNNNQQEDMIAHKNRIKKPVKRNKANKAELEKIRTRAKFNAPGFPQNTCPYIDLTITAVMDLLDCYNRLNEKGEQSPTVDTLAQHAQDTLEYIRKSNESLRDNSGYWYNKYKQLLLTGKS